MSISSNKFDAINRNIDCSNKFDTLNRSIDSSNKFDAINRNIDSSNKFDAFSVDPSPANSSTTNLVLSNPNCTGLNSTLYSVRFSNSSIVDIIKLVIPFSYMYIFDIESFYPTLAYAEEFKSYSTFKFENTWYVGDFIILGISSAPAFCATFTAEILFILAKKKLMLQL